MTLRKYVKDQKDETKGNRGKKNRIASCYVRFRRKGTVKERDSEGFGTLYWWLWGSMNGSAATIENALKTFKNQTQMLTRTIGNQKTGNETAKITIPLKDLSPAAIALMRNSSYDPKPKYTNFPGTRKYLSNVAGVFVTSNTYEIEFSTKNVETDEVTGSTAVSIIFSSDDTAMKAAIVSAIKANAGIANAVWTTNSLTITTKPGVIMIVSEQATNSGGTAAAVTNTETDTSILKTSIDVSNGVLNRLQLPLATGGGAIIQQAFDNAPEGALVQIGLLTGDVVTEPEYPLVARVVGDILYLNEAIDQLPADLVDVHVIAGFRDFPGGDNLKEFELQLEFRDHSNKAVETMYIPCFSCDETTKMPEYTENGMVGTIGGVCTEEIFNVDGDDILLPFIFDRTNSAVGAY